MSRGLTMLRSLAQETHLRPIDFPDFSVVNGGIRAEGTAGGRSKSGLEEGVS